MQSRFASHLDRLESATARAGLVALLEEVRRTATVRARTPCLLLTLDRRDFRDLLDEVPELRRVFETAALARREAF